MRMNVQEIMNMKNWILDGWTTSAFNNNSSMGYTLDRMINQYLMANGSRPEVIEPLLCELDVIYRKLQSLRLHNGNPDRM